MIKKQNSLRKDMWKLFWVNFQSYLKILFQDLVFGHQNTANPTQQFVESGGNCGLLVEILTVTGVSICGAAHESTVLTALKHSANLNWWKEQQINLFVTSWISVNCVTPTCFQTFKIMNIRNTLCFVRYMYTTCKFDIFLAGVLHCDVFYNRPSVLDNFALLSGQLNTINKLLKNEKTPSFRHQVIIPLLLSPDRDEDLAVSTSASLLRPLLSEATFHTHPPFPVRN